MTFWYWPSWRVTAVERQPISCGTDRRADPFRGLLWKKARSGLCDCAQLKSGDRSVLAERFPMLDNAIHYNRTAVRSDFRTCPANGFAVDIQDTAAESSGDLVRVFERFYRVKISTRGRDAGLAALRARRGDSGGRISVARGWGRPTFTITMPGREFEVGDLSLVVCHFYLSFCGREQRLLHKRQMKMTTTMTISTSPIDPSHIETNGRTASASARIRQNVRVRDPFPPRSVSEYVHPERCP